MELAFAGLHQLCAPFLARLDHLPVPQRAALRTAFGLEIGDRPDRFLVGLAVLSLLADVAETQPLVCLLDDIHWLDHASAQVLGFVARRLAAESVVMVFAIREPWDDHHLAGLPELSLPPLPDADSRALLAATLPGRLDETVRDRIVAEAHGNPLALLEIPRAWTPAALAGGFGLPDGDSVSGRIEESFRRRLLPLPEDSQSLLLIAAAEPTGDPDLIWSAATQLGVGPEASESAVAAGLLDAGTDLRFRHPLVRTVVYREARDPARRRVHAALADSTDAAHDPDRRAWHLGTAAAGPDEDVAAELERSAGRAQARGGPAAAAAFLARSVELTEAAPRRAERALAAAQASFLAGAFEEAEQLLAVAESNPLDRFQRGQAAFLRGQIAVVHGYGNDAAPLLLDAARQLEPFDRDLARGAYLSAYSSAFVAPTLPGQASSSRSAAPRKTSSRRSNRRNPWICCSRVSVGPTRTAAISRSPSSDARRTVSSDCRQRTSCFGDGSHRWPATRSGTTPPRPPSSSGSRGSFASLAPWPTFRSASLRWPWTRSGLATS
jgi:hypothetical protein